ncbi:HsdM family class I SAM-dependent methyltransferase [Candidatus Endoriftia persephone]|uniref:HsdM family class I SAM-dependent methyltransferase n=1 Tax=Candidatus Endoriftia persephonae TaxID=393765 RepID=UPI0020730891|nr:N-6 DNA methylase [Candidatus Endoriftia persephone]
MADVPFTPVGVSALVAKLLALRSGETLCDPFCGSGSLLLSCVNDALERDKAAHNAMFGQERSQSAWSLSKLNLYLNGHVNHRIALGDSIRAPQLIDIENRLKRFDVVVSQPPIGDTNKATLRPFSTCLPHSIKIMAEWL